MKSSTAKIALTNARRAIRQTAIDAGYKFCMSSNDYANNTATMTADVSSRYYDRFVISCGCDHRLPQEERTRLWREHGKRFVSLLQERGFKPDLKTFGCESDYRTIVVNVEGAWS